MLMAGYYHRRNPLGGGFRIYADYKEGRQSWGYIERSQLNLPWPERPRIVCPKGMAFGIWRERRRN